MAHEEDPDDVLDRLINQLATHVAEQGYEPDDVVVSLQDAMEAAYEDVEEEDDSEEEEEFEEEDDDL